MEKKDIVISLTMAKEQKEWLKQEAVDRGFKTMSGYICKLLHYVKENNIKL